LTDGLIDALRTTKHVNAHISSFIAKNQCIERAVNYWVAAHNDLDWAVFSIEPDLTFDWMRPADDNIHLKVTRGHIIDRYSLQGIYYQAPLFIVESYPDTPQWLWDALSSLSIPEMSRVLNLVINVDAES